MRRSTTSQRVAIVVAGWAFAAIAFADPLTGGTVSEPADTAPQLLNQAELSYPETALAEGLHGDVRVRASIDADGRVTAVEWVSGDEVFRAEAERAALTLRFAPATHDGVATIGTALVVFHFAPPEPPSPASEPLDDEIIVTGHRDTPTDTHATVTLEAAELDRAAGQDLAETVAETPGVTLGRGSADTAKPIIRGQVERRLLLLYDGIRHESQKWGPDHAPEIDPFSAGSITIVRGASGVRYGPDAIGGVILVEPPPLREEPGVGGKALLLGASNGRRGYGALRIDAVSAKWPQLSSRIEGNFGQGASLSAPDYVLGNTASRSWNLGGSIGYHRGETSVRAAVHHHDFLGGVYYGIVNATPAEFEAQLATERPLNADRWDTAYAIDRPKQHVRHDIASIHVDTRTAAWAWHARYAFQLNRREEFEQAREAVTGPQYDFTLRTHAIDVGATHDRFDGAAGTLDGGLGVQASFQENVYAGLPLLPNYRSFLGGVFAHERWARGNTTVEFGARYDHLDRSAYLGRSDYERHVRRGTLSDGDCEARDTGTFRCPLRYDTASVSLGGTWAPIADHIEVKLDLSSASRFPNADELYLIGSAPSFPVFAYGAPDLRPEVTWGASPTLGFQTRWITGEASVYANLVQRYVQFSPERNADGEPRYEVTIRGAFPAWAFAPVDALFAGADGMLSVAPESTLGLDVQASVVRAHDTATGAFLIGIPPDRARAALIARPGPLGPLRETSMRVTGEFVARQSRVDPAMDFAPAPAAYALLGVSASMMLPVGADDIKIGVEATNLLNTKFRDYTSLLRYYADQPGRDIRARISIDF